MIFLRLLMLLTVGYSQAVLISKLPLPGAYDDTIIGQGTATFLTKAEAARVRREQASGTLRTSYTTDKLPPEDDPRRKNEPGFYGPLRNEFGDSDRNYNRGGDRNDYRGSDRNENGSGHRMDNSGDRNYGSGGRNGHRDRNENIGDRNEYRGDRNDNRGDRNDNRGDRNDYRGDRNNYRGEDRNRFVGDRNDFRDNRFDGPDRRYNEREGNRDEYRGNRDEVRGGDRPNEYPGDRRGDPRNNHGSNEIFNENRRDYYPTHDPTTNKRKFEECGSRCGPNSYKPDDRPPRDNPPRVVFIQPRPLQRPRPDGYQGAVLRGGPRPGYQGGQRRGPPNESTESETPYRNLPPSGLVRDGFRGQGPPPSWEPRNTGFRNSDGGGSGEDSSWNGRRNNIFPRASGLIPVYDTPVGSFEQDRIPDESSGSRRRQTGQGSSQDGPRSRDCMDEEGRRDMSRPGCASRWKMEPEESLTGEGTVGFYGRARRE